MTREEEYRAIQDVPTAPLAADIRGLCRSVFGIDWMDRGVDSALEQYAWLPEAFTTLYSIIGGEERLHYGQSRPGFLPANEVYTEQQWEEDFLVYYRAKKTCEFAFSRTCRSGVPFCGIFRHDDNDMFAYNKWERWYNWVRDWNLNYVLFIQVGETIINRLPNCVWVKLSFRGVEGCQWYKSATERLGLTPSEIAPDGGSYGFAYDVENGLVMEFNDDSRKVCMVYSQNAEALEKLGETFPIIWQKRDGKKILDSKKFIKSEAPQTFAEKLDMMASILLGKRSMALPMEEIEKSEARLGETFPQALKEFYLRFGKGGKLFTAINTIYTPKELHRYTVEDQDNDENINLTEKELDELGGDIVLAEENQVVWWIRLSHETGKPYFDFGDGQHEDTGMSLEDTLLWLLAFQSLDTLPRGGECFLDKSEDSTELMSHFFHFLSTGKYSVFVSPERGLVGYRENDGMLYIKARQGKALESLEEDTGLMVGDL